MRSFLSTLVILQSFVFLLKSEQFLPLAALLLVSVVEDFELLEIVKVGKYTFTLRLSIFLLDLQLIYTTAFISCIKLVGSMIWRLLFPFLVDAERPLAFRRRHILSPA